MEKERETNLVLFATLLENEIKKIEDNWRVFSIAAHNRKGNIFIRIQKVKEPKTTRLIVYTATGEWIVSPEENEEI